MSQLAIMRGMPQDSNRMTDRSVAYVLKRFPRLSETFILNEILALERLGLKIHIISLHQSDTKITHSEIQSLRAQVYYLPESFWREIPRMLIAQGHFLRHYRGRWIHAFSVMVRRFSLKAAQRWLQSGTVAQRLEGSDASHIHAHYSTAPTTVAMITGILLNLHFSFTCHAKDVYADGRLHSPGFFRNLTRADFVVCVSAKTKQDIVETWAEIPAAKVHVIYNGLNLERFPRRRTEPSERLILSVGRLVEKKGFPYLIEACKLLKEHSVPFKCEIVGYGDLRNELAELVSTLHLEHHIELIGPLAQQELVEYYRKAKIFCLPTMIADNDDRDVLPNVVKEAMAIGVPVLTTNTPAMNELVEHERTGLLVPPRNPSALTEALERLLADDKLGGRLADAGRLMVEARFDRSKNVYQLKNLFEPYLVSQSIRSTRMRAS